MQSFHVIRYDGQAKKIQKIKQKNTPFFLKCFHIILTKFFDFSADFIQLRLLQHLLHFLPNIHNNHKSNCLNQRQDVLCF